ncbi:diguanylate cyclase domain-containing protein [Sphingomonas sp. FW199]|uniref:GGDEF domain-containing protein n=1 Tax=Sphingomonas sp. FW199 TaxID=3400217 RepID=UPI003CE6D7D2
MRFYRATRFLFPTSLRLRMFAICFVGTHVPLFALIGWEAWRGAIGWTPVIVVLIATLIGTAFSLTAINALLHPVRASARALRAMSDGKAAPLDQMDSRDLMGALIASVNRAATSAGERMRELGEAANRDALTGLLNRRGFHALIDGAPGERPAGTLALIDIDHFKAINDDHGHGAGDHVLRLFAQRLIAGLRRGDVIARWGGEEFLIFLPATTMGDARAIIDRLAGESRMEPVAAIGGCAITFSAGLTPWVAGHPHEAAMLRVDAALYAAKRAGRDCIRETAEAVQSA